MCSDRVEQRSTPVGKPTPRFDEPPMTDEEQAALNESYRLALVHKYGTADLPWMAKQ